jgi:hypothetical protein
VLDPPFVTLTAQGTILASIPILGARLLGRGKNTIFCYLVNQILVKNKLFGDVWVREVVPTEQLLSIIISLFRR